MCHEAISQPFNADHQDNCFSTFPLIATVQTVVLVLLTYAVLHVQETSLMKDVQQSAFRFERPGQAGDTAQHDAEQERGCERHHPGCCGEPGIEGIRIYNKEGRVIFATIPGDLNSTVDMNAEACVSCHPYGGLEIRTLPQTIFPVSSPALRGNVSSG